MGAANTDPTTAPDMAARIAAELEENVLAHEWIVAAEVTVDTRTAKRAALRLQFRAEGGQRIDALDVYCKKCRRPLDDVLGEDCAAKIDNTHLIGGNPGERAKRIKHEPRGRMIKMGPVNRRGLAGYSPQMGR